VTIGAIVCEARCYQVSSPLRIVFRLKRTLECVYLPVVDQQSISGNDVEDKLILNQSSIPSLKAMNRPGFAGGSNS
jgi:hypothetical protein